MVKYKKLYVLKLKAVKLSEMFPQTPDFMKVDEEEVPLPGTNFDEVIDVIQVTKLRDIESHFLTKTFPGG